MTTDEKYMHRCLDLARLGAGSVAPNPMVGAVLVYKDKIIGEGWHEQYGREHAEVNCLNSVKPGFKNCISDSVLYVSLEPCSHFGKTPPCTDLIIKNKIPRVVIACRDPNAEVNGKGIEQLRGAGIEITLNVLETEARKLNARFFTWHGRHRPYIILKWAQTHDGFMGIQGERVQLSNEFSNRLVHKWRSEEAAILIGTNTAITDDPLLTTRLWPGRSPVRLVIDMDLKLSPSLKLFTPPPATIVFNKHRHDEQENGVSFYQVTGDVSIVPQVLNALLRLNLQSVIIEGGPKLLQSFIEENSWDEARVITNSLLSIKTGLPAPVIEKKYQVSSFKAGSDMIDYYGNVSHD